MIALAARGSGERLSWDVGPRHDRADVDERDAGARANQHRVAVRAGTGVGERGEDQGDEVVPFELISFELFRDPLLSPEALPLSRIPWDVGRLVAVTDRRPSSTEAPSSFTNAKNPELPRYTDPCVGKVGLGCAPFKRILSAHDSPLYGPLRRCMMHLASRFFVPRGRLKLPTGKSRPRRQLQARHRLVRWLLQPQWQW